jgi:ATP-dependent Clp protease ATP-binding subunit ClpA
MSDDIGPSPTPRYSRVVDASAGVAREMGHSYVGVEHLFLAMIRDRSAVPTQVLARSLDLDQIEASLLDEMASPGYRGEPAAP